jgi:hypothetical protein
MPPQTGQTTATPKAHFKTSGNNFSEPSENREKSRCPTVFCARSEAPQSAACVERHYRPIAAFHRLFKFLQCGTSLRPFVYRAALCRLKRRSADLAVIDPFPLIAGSGALRQPKRRTLLHFAIHNIHLRCCSLASGKALTFGDIFRGFMSMVRSRAKLRVQPECQLQLVAIFDTTFWTSNAS